MGLRWQKMTDNEGDESPSSVGAFLIWQQPHFIYMAEMLIAANQHKEVLNKYKDLLLLLLISWLHFQALIRKQKNIISEKD
jgi:hypothetical protein